MVILGINLPLAEIIVVLHALTIFLLMRILRKL